MEVILREDIEKLGSRGSVVKVAPGFARNFLLPKRLAVAATEANKKIVAQEREAWLRKEAKVKGEAEELAKLLSAVTITISHSSFDPARLTVRVGEPVTFVLVNTDPIDHEWLIGDEAFHRAHRTGTHAVHGAVPTEVSLPALGTSRTTITFDEPGTYLYICHLPRHEAYGMVGTLVVVP